MLLINKLIKIDEFVLLLLLMLVVAMLICLRLRLLRVLNKGQRADMTKTAIETMSAVTILCNMEQGL